LLQFSHINKTKIYALKVKGNRTKKKIKVLLDFFQKILGFQRTTPLVAFRRKRNPYALGAFLLLFAIEKEAEFEADPHKLPQQFS